MMLKNKIFVVLSISAALLWADITIAASKQMSDHARIQRLERLLDSKGLVDLLIRLENLQKEVQLLRGEVELQTHTLESIKKRQRDLYVDIDRRLLKLERSTTAGTGAYTGSAPAATVKDSGKKGSQEAAADKKKASHSFVKEQKAYQNAFELLRDLRYDKSILAFRKFLKKYPDGRYAHIAQYWLGEANYAQRNFKSAIEDYNRLVTLHPKSPKAAEAMLKIGYSYYEMKDYKQARQSLQKLIKAHPKSTESGQGKNLIAKIDKKLK